uniref:Uncharacterized protein n=2 Tax=Neisseria meningitidis TaxID=487 RepID=C6SGN2_NEIME|nr:hypothetical protein predicted by Glimmer/Critica [Neisseria meningitidis alpha275]CCA45326.1 hypothetical protein NMALPHA522_1785 [Neisseria meningitidis alpha522]
MPEQPAPPNKCRLKPEKASDGIFPPLAFRRNDDAASCRQGGSACRNTGRQRCPILLRTKAKTLSDARSTARCRVPSNTAADFPATRKFPADSDCPFDFPLRGWRAPILRHRQAKGYFRRKAAIRYNPHFSDGIP